MPKKNAKDAMEGKRKKGRPRKGRMGGVKIIQYNGSKKRGGNGQRPWGMGRALLGGKGGGRRRSGSGTSSSGGASGGSSSNSSSSD